MVLGKRPQRSRKFVLALAALLIASTALFAAPAYAAAEDQTGGSPNLWNQIVSFFTGEPAEDNGGIEIYSAGEKKRRGDAAGVYQHLHRACRAAGAQARGA